MSQKIICYKCEAKQQILDSIKPLSTVNCEQCQAEITVPYVIGGMIIESKIAENKHYITYKAYQQSTGDKLIVRIAESDHPIEVKHKAIEQLNIINANKGNELLITELEEKILFIRPDYAQSLTAYFSEKRPTAENAYRTVLSLTEQLEELADQELYLKDLKLDNLFIDSSGKLLLTDLSIDWAFDHLAATYIADIKTAISAYKAVVYEIFCGASFTPETKQATLKLRDKTPQDLHVFVNEIIQMNPIFKNFDDALNVLKRVDLNKCQGNKKEETPVSSPKIEKKKSSSSSQLKTNSTPPTKLKSKNILKKNRRKSSVSIPAILTLMILAGAAYFVIQDGTIFKLNKKPEVVKKAPEPKNKKVVKLKKKEPVKVVEVREIKPLPKVEETVDMKGQISLHSFKDILESNFISCHGAKGKDVKGKFNLVKLMASNGVHNKHWAAVYKQVESGEMPPEEETPLTEDEKLVVLSELRQMTSQTAVNRATRALTPDEIKNTLVDIFQMHQNTYNPFTPLYANYAQDDFYSTQKSVITPYYLDDLYETLQNALESYVALKPITEPMNQSVSFPNRIHLQEKHGSNSDLRWGRRDIDFVQTTFKISIHRKNQAAKK